MGKLILTILAAIFEFFRFDNADRVRDNMVVRVKEGKRMNNPPYGYRMIEKKMVVVPEEAELIKYIYTEYLKGYGIVALEKKTGRDRSTIKQWLQNKVFAGYNVFGKKKTSKTTFKQVKNLDESKIIEIKGDWEAIIDIVTWEKVALRMNTNKEFRIRNITNTSYLLSGLLFHRICGSKFRGNPGRKGTNYYRCSQCNKSIRDNVLERKVLDELFASDFLDEFSQETENNTVNNEKQLRKLRTLRASTLSKEKRLVELFTEELISKNSFKNKKEEIQRQLAEIELQIDSLQENKEEEKENLSFKKMFIQALSNLKNSENKTEANKILKQIIKKIEVDENKEVFIYLNI